MDALRSSFVLLILCLCIHVVETVNTSSTDIVQEKEVVLGEVMESAALQFDNNYKTDDSKWQTSHTSNIIFMVQSKETNTDGELEAFQPITHSSKDATDDKQVAYKKV